MFGTGTEACQTVNSVLTLTGPSEIQVGLNYKGMFKELSVLDYPKTDYEFYDSVQTAGCTAWNGVACNM